MLRNLLPSTARLLAVRLDNIGDVVMLGPALKALKSAFPQSRISLLTSPAGSEVAPLLPGVDEVLVLKALWQDASAALEFDSEREQKTIRALADGRFDAAFIFTSFSQSPYPPAYASYLAGIPIRVGQSKEFGGGVLSHSVRAAPDALHQVDRNLHLLASVGIPAVTTALELNIPREAELAAASLLDFAGIRENEPYIAVAPGASCPARRYPEPRFAELISLLADHVQTPLVLLGREGEFGTPIAHDLVVPLIGKTTVPEFCALLKNSKFILANDSSAMHIGDAFGRPMLILFSGTELEEQWRPRTSYAKLLRKPTFCSPCYRFHCPFEMECLDFRPAQILEEILPLITELAQGRLPTAGVNVPPERTPDWIVDL